MLGGTSLGASSSSGTSGGRSPPSWGNCALTVVLSWCYRGVTVVLLQCDYDVTMVYYDVTMVLL
jgi:hypothetical protein